MPLGAPRPGRSYVLRGRRVGLVLAVSGPPWREEVSLERRWPVSVLTDTGVERWAWGEYSGEDWVELSGAKTPDD